MFIRPLILDPTAGKGGQGTTLFMCALSSARHLISVPWSVRPPVDLSWRTGWLRASVPIPHAATPRPPPPLLRASAPAPPLPAGGRPRPPRTHAARPALASPSPAAALPQSAETARPSVAGRRSERRAPPASIFPIAEATSDA
nr:branchpoint-bridging protein-like [Lolium perenne]